MHTINDLQNNLIADFEMLEGWEDKYNYIIDLGKTLAPLDATHKTDQNRIRGCQAQVWLVAQMRPDGTLHLQADSDAIITKGLIALLVGLLNHQPAADIRTTDLYFIQKIGLIEHLSPTRSNGFAGMVAQIKYYAAQHSA
jgi:cysteine desulfuration protein SufE